MKQISIIILRIPRQLMSPSQVPYPKDWTDYLVSDQPPIKSVRTPSFPLHARFYPVTGFQYRHAGHAAGHLQIQRPLDYSRLVPTALLCSTQRRLSLVPTAVALPHPRTASALPRPALLVPTAPHPRTARQVPAFPLERAPTPYYHQRHLSV